MKTARKVILLPNIKTLILTFGEKNCLSLFTTNLRWDKLVSETNIFYLFIYLFCFQVNIGRIGRFYNIVHKFGRLSMLVNSHLLVITVLNVQELLVFSNMTLLILWICFQFIKSVYILLNFVSLIQSVTPQLCKVCLFLKTKLKLFLFTNFSSEEENCIS